MTAIPGLLNDLVDEILCRVPATSLKRLRSTCKRWNRLFKDDKRFASEHCDKAAKEFLFLMLTEKYSISPLSVNYLPHGDGDGLPSVEVKSELILPYRHSNSQFKIAEVFHCDGLLLCTHHGLPPHGSDIVVWNPLTGQIRWIETGSRLKGTNEFVLGYCYNQDKKNMPCTKSFKILYFDPLGEITEIYELNSSDSDPWRRIRDGELTAGWNTYVAEDAVSSKGNYYYIAKEKSKPHLGLSLLKFDFSTEKSSVCVPLPYPFPSYEILSVSSVGGEKLALFLQPNPTYKSEIWVTSKIDDDSTKVVSWSKVLAFDLSPDLQITSQVKFVLDEDKKVVLCCERWMDDDEIHSDDKIFILGEDNKVSEISSGLMETDDKGLWPCIFSYVPSLDRIEGAGGGKRKRAR
ncbi:hypothetical protein CARUB_v10015872mg [Capsella rubella]|uniref:F-box domain-containing protein n=1 Tax=Capsella rubella TaxID=81985 RepID=R0GA70_9BRAS|nr:hypothetical protein CARUB_v10015872mg [Capsella rubella]